MNTFLKKMKLFFKKSSFGIAITTLAILFVIGVGLVISSNSNKPPIEVGKVSDQISKVEESESLLESNNSESEQKEEKICLPFLVSAKISRYFFDPNDSIDIKSNALVSYENKIIPSQGIDYTYDNKAFNVTSSFTGKVVSKINDTMYGLTVVVENDNGIKAYYSGLSEVNVMNNQAIRQGTVIGKSGESLINASLGNHLHFAIEYDNNFLNPLKCFEKTANEVLQIK